MSEQIYSTLAHGAPGLVWWGQWPDSTPFNQEYAALLYSWTTMSQTLNDQHTYDTLLTYMLLVQSSYPVDILSEDQVTNGMLEHRTYRALGVIGGAALPENAEILARYDDGTPAIAQIAHGQGTIILAGSPLGWDYSDYPGYYDLAAMFPFRTHRDATLREWLAGVLAQRGIMPPAQSSHSHVEVAWWHNPTQDRGILIAVNHLRETVETELSVQSGEWSVCDALTGQPVAAAPFSIALESLDGRAFRLERA